MATIEQIEAGLKAYHEKLAWTRDLLRMCRPHIAQMIVAMDLTIERGTERNKPHHQAKRDQLWSLLQRIDEVLLKE